MSTHLLHSTTTDWASENHRRIVAASLIQGVYNLEKIRRRKGKDGNKPDIEKAEAIGERLGFEIKERHKAVNDGTSSNSTNNNETSSTNNEPYLAIVYEYKYFPSENCKPEISPPKYLVAFKGTSTKRDFISNFEFISHRLHNSELFKQVVKIVQEIITISGGPENVWLAGHSLGAAIALMVGRHMVINNDCYLNSYLFNPPFLHYGNLKPLRDILWYQRSFITGGAESNVRHLSPREENDQVFEKLKTWKPNLFVNKRDYICNSYITYFKQRTKMKKLGAGKMENRTTQNSVLCLLGEAMGEDVEHVYLIPSASMSITKGSYTLPRRAHKLKQWWENTDLPIQNESYVFIDQ